MLIGVDIGGTKCAYLAARETPEGVRILERHAFETAGKTPQEVLRLFDAGIEEYRKTYRDTSVRAIGISCGGPLDSASGVILSPPNLPGWDFVEITRHFTDTFGVPSRLINDANASALAEWKYGAGVGTKNMIFLTFGTGLGAGLILNGALYEGACGMAGEVGHMRLSPFGPAGYGKCGSFEGFCSGGGIAELAKSLAREALQRGESVGFVPNGDLTNVDISAKTVAKAAYSGDKTACEVFRISGEKLGEGLSVLMDLFNPEKIVIGSIFTRCRDLLWKYAEPVIRAEALELNASVCAVVPAALGEQIGDYAALAAASEALKN